MYYPTVIIITTCIHFGAQRIGSVAVLSIYEGSAGDGRERIKEGGETANPVQKVPQQGGGKFQIKAI